MFVLVSVWPLNLYWYYIAKFEKSISHYVDFPNCRVLNSYEKWKLTVKKRGGGVFLRQLDFEI